MQVLSRRDVKHVRPEVPYVVISIANPTAPHPTLLDSPLRRGVLRLAFDDVGASRKDERGDQTPMTPGHAREIREFVEAHLEEVELIVVHCDAGMCRAPAVAAALWRWREQERGPFFKTFSPNAHVYRTLSEELFR